MPFSLRKSSKNKQLFCNVHAQIGTEDNICGNKQWQKRVFGFFLSLGLSSSGREKERAEERETERGCCL